MLQVLVQLVMLLLTPTVINKLLDHALRTFQAEASAQFLRELLQAACGSACCGGARPSLSSPLCISFHILLLRIVVQPIFIQMVSSRYKLACQACFAGCRYL